ncbi:MAG: hypothetical protein Q7R52_00010 [archaeon]|nr:hypothetical protein [archaeon]
MDDIEFLKKQLDLVEETIIKAFTDFPANAFRLTPGKRAGRYQHIKQVRNDAIAKKPGVNPKHVYLSPSKHRDFNDSVLTKLGVNMPEHLKMTTNEAKTEKKMASERLGRPVSGYKPPTIPK